jgi:hypothetical protein
MELFYILERHLGQLFHEYERMYKALEFFTGAQHLYLDFKKMLI